MGFTGCGKTPSVKWFVSGHEFTRAAKAAESTSGFSPCWFSSTEGAFFRSLERPAKYASGFSPC
jgi:hypothetical protein